MKFPFHPVSNAGFSNRSTLVSTVQNMFFPIVLWSCTCETSHFCFGEQQLPPRRPAMDVMLKATMHNDLIDLQMVNSRTEILTSSNDFFKSGALTLGLFFTTLRILHCAFGVFLGPSSRESSHSDNSSQFIDSLSNPEDE